MLNPQGLLLKKYFQELHFPLMGNGRVAESNKIVMRGCKPRIAAPAYSRLKVYHYV
jgi:hypothetical protein